MKRALLCVLLVIALATLTVNCNLSDQTSTRDRMPLQNTPDFIGSITRVEEVGKNGILGTILVEYTGIALGTDKYLITVPDQSFILKQDGKIVSDIHFESLKAGQQARIWFSGPVRESYPAQVDAAQVMIAEHKNVDEVRLGEEFLLAFGKSAWLVMEDLQITFEGVIEDSRCPRNATCVWEGKVSVEIEIMSGDSSHSMILNQPGLSEQYSRETYGGYELAFTVRPYPEAGMRISEQEYVLVVIISKEDQQSMGILRGHVTIGPIQPVVRPNDDPDYVPPEVYDTRKIVVYDESGKMIMRQVNIGHEGYYSVELAPGTYVIDINRLGIDTSGDVPRKVDVIEGETIELDIDIDTGIR